MENEREHFCEKIPKFKSGKTTINNVTYDLRMVEGCGAILTIDEKGQVLDSITFSRTDLVAIYGLLNCKN